jgi:hypothetical protein
MELVTDIVGETTVWVIGGVTTAVIIAAGVAVTRWGVKAARFLSSMAPHFHELTAAEINAGRKDRSIPGRIARIEARQESMDDRQAQMATEIIAGSEAARQVAVDLSAHLADETRVGQAAARRERTRDKKIDRLLDATSPTTPPARPARTRGAPK